MFSLCLSAIGGVGFFGLMSLSVSRGNWGEQWENWVSEGFLWEERDRSISPKNRAFDVRWVRFPKHIPLFSTLSHLESVGFKDSSDWVQRCLRELVVETTV